MDKNKLSEKIDNLTQEEVWTVLSKLPISVQELIYSENSAKINANIFTKFELTENQIQKLLNIFILIYDRQIPVSQLPEIIKNELEMSEKKSKDLSLEISLKKLWPIYRYLGGIDKLIKTLGGELPKENPEISEEQIAKDKTSYTGGIFNVKTGIESEDQQTFATDSVVQQNIKTIIEEKGIALDQRITSLNIISASTNEERPGSIKYWIQEYMQTMGAGYHPNIDRIGFLYNNSNAKKLSDDERVVLGAVLKSYDDGDNLPFSKTTEKLLIEKLKQ